MRKIGIGVALILAIILISCATASFNPAIDSSKALLQPSWEHLLGCDFLGRDLLSLMSSGVLISVSVAALTVFISISVGLLLALAMSFKSLSFFAFPISDSLKLLPTVPLALFFSSVGGPGVWKLVLAMSITMIPVVSRACYARLAVLKKERFILSSYAMGKSHLCVFFTHMLPHLQSYLREQSVSLFLSSILLESSLSYLGAGLPAGTPSLGRIIADAKAYMLSEPLQLLFPALLLFLIGFSLVMVIKGLSELDSAS